MLDTVKVAIPITRAQHNRIHRVASQTDVWNWALRHQTTGDLIIKRHEALVTTDGESYHREIRFFYPPEWSRDARLWLEFSVPKLWYGHNIHLLYDWLTALKHCRNLIVEQFDLKRSRFPKVEDWQVWRADACYAYRMPSQQIAQQYLDGLKRQRFPYKKPTINPTSIFWGGGTYSFKVYLKRPEFEAHDKKALLKDNASLEWVEHLEGLAEGVLRVEASMRRKYLQRMEVQTIADLVQDKCEIEWDKHLEKIPGFNWMFSAMAISSRLLNEHGVTRIYRDESTHKVPLVNGAYYHAPDMAIETPTVCYYHPAGGYIYRRQPILLFKLRELLVRFMGGNQGMETIDKLESILLQHYKPVTAANLVSFWLYVRQFGADKAKETFGRRPYYYKRKQLKDVGIGLMEAHENIIKVDAEFFRNFKLDIPCEYVSNKVDDFRDSGNLLNYPAHRDRNQA